MSEKWFDYRDRTVAFDAEEGKWTFNGRFFKRQGQAENAARKHWKKHHD